MTESYHDDYDGEPKPDPLAVELFASERMRLLLTEENEKLQKAHDIMQDTLTRCQEECTRLLNENRALRMK